MSQTHEQLSYSLATYDHCYYGRCPSHILGWQSRDPNCPACAALTEVDRLRASVAELEAEVERLSRAHCDASHYAARVAELDAERKRMLDSLIVTAMELDELRARAEELEDENARLLAALQAAVRANKALLEGAATNTPAAPTRQYFYKNNACQAADSADSDCICWHDDGTGPRHEESHGVRLRWREAR